MSRKASQNTQYIKLCIRWAATPEKHIGSTLVENKEQLEAGAMNFKI